MKNKNTKLVASSNRAAANNQATASGFGSPSGPAFGSASSAISYLVEQPNLSLLSEPNVVVFFKNTLKKDSTTRSKALDDLLTYVTKQAEDQSVLEDPLIEVWIKVFPRLSIDASRRVRQLTFALQRCVGKASGKRLAKHMPAIAPPWLAGCHDSDRAVMRTARDGLQSLFGSPEKQINLRKAYQSQIIAFGTDVVENETKDSLSDPKNTNAEDAESVYSRVVSTSLSSITEMISMLNPAEIEPHTSACVSLCDSDRFLNLLSSGDSSCRRAIYSFIKACFIRFETNATRHAHKLTRFLLSKRIIRSQTGTSNLFIEVLTLLTGHCPNVWTTDKTVETLQSIGKQGSQLGGESFWINFGQLFEVIPDHTLPREATRVQQIIDGIRAGIDRRDERELNQAAAWRCYFKALARLCENTSPEDTKTLGISLGMSPIRQFIRPEPNLSSTRLNGSDSTQVLSEALSSDLMQDAVETDWPSLTQLLVQDMQTSLPATSNDFRQSQIFVQEEAKRFFTLQDKADHGSISDALSQIFLQSRNIVLKECTNILTNREGKPFGVAGCIQSALEHQTTATRHSSMDVDSNLEAFIRSRLPNLLNTPSGSCLIHVLFLFSPSETFQQSWTASLETALDWNNSNDKRRVIIELLNDTRIPWNQTQVFHHTKLQHYISSIAIKALESTESDCTNILLGVDPHRLLSDDSLQDITALFVEKLGSDESPRVALDALKQLGRRRPETLSKYGASEDGSGLVQALLKGQQDGGSEESLLASEILATLNSDLSGGASALSQSQLSKVLGRSLYEADASSLNVDTLVQTAWRQIFTSPNATTLSEVLPDAQRWSAALQPFLSESPPPSFTILGDLGGFLPSNFGARESMITSLPSATDALGQTVLLRISMYTAQVLSQKQKIALSSLSAATKHSMFRLLALSAGIANDRLSNSTLQPLWYDREIDDDVMNFISQARVVLQQLVSVDVDQLGYFASMESKSIGKSSEAFYHAREWARMQAQAIETAGWQTQDTGWVEDRLTSLKQQDEGALHLAAFISAFQIPLQGSKALLRLVNETIAKLTALDAEKQLDDAHQNLALLSLTISIDDTTLDNAAKQRLVFLVKHLIPWLSLTSSNSVKAELCKILTKVLPHLADVYGEDWEKVLDYLRSCWIDATPLKAPSTDDAIIALWHSSLKLFAVLRNLCQNEESNEDLKEAWNEKIDGLARGLANLLAQSASSSEEINLPLRITNELLARQIKAVPASKLGDLSGLYALLDTRSREVQQTAFDILHRQIPQEQEELSVTVAVDKTIARLPDELLSLIMETPEPELYEDLDFEDGMPASLFTYLSSWLLVFDHFRKASHKLQTDYANHIKEQAVHVALLDMIFATLGHARSKPIDASKFDATFYSFNVESNQKRDTQWLLIHLYYLCLSRLPSLTKSWWIDCRSRQVRTHVEPWTEKYFSPLVIADALQKTASWAKQQDQSAEDALVVKTNERTHEVTASKEIDDQEMSIVIRLPSNFPLSQVSVDGVNRVAVEEKKWKNWLLTTQGVITFSDNSIADGLITFRRNLSGQLKGHTECAICYSIVSQDKQLPTKKCKTCSNVFHGSCLFRWFKSSNSSSCPLCRTSFNYA